LKVERETRPAKVLALGRNGTLVRVRLGTCLCAASGLAVAPDSAAIFTALQEQLRLRLEARRSTLDVIVIDHVERPAPD